MTASPTSTGDIEVVVNGSRRTASPDVTVESFLRHHDLDPDRVVVERNGWIVPRSEQGATVLAEGDALEIVHLVGGG